MKILTRNYLIFVTICILLFVYFYFIEYYYTINIYDTYYLISYFFFVPPILLIGSLFYLRKVLIYKIQKSIEELGEQHYSKYFLMLLKPISYLKIKSVTKNYLIFVLVCILLFAYLYVSDYFYLATYNGTFHFVSYYYFALVVFIVGSIVYLTRFYKIKNK